MRAIAAAFPKDPRQARKILNQAMSGAAKEAIIPTAKQLARAGDSSGALSDSIAPRAVSLARSLAQGKGAIVHVTPLRGDRAAMAKYISFYYTGRGKTAPAKMITSGIRHGHLVEFGTVKTGARPFLWPAAEQGRSAYVKAFAKFVEKKIAAAVRRKAKRAKR